MPKKPKNKSDFIYATTPLEQIPIYYQGYAKAHRHFEAVVAKYEPLYQNLVIAKDFNQWISWIRRDISQVEKLIEQVEKGEITLEDFRLYRLDLANEQLQVTLDTFLPKTDWENADNNHMIEKIHEAIRNAGYIVYEYWTESRLPHKKIEEL